MPAYQLRGHEVLLDSELAEDLDFRKLYVYPRGNSLYVLLQRKNCTPIYLHRIAALARRGQVVDHINGNTLDNRRENLRLTTASVNVQKSKMLKNNTSGFRGVGWAKRERSWSASIHHQDHKYCLGHYDSKEEAAKAYDAAARFLFGEHATVNFR